MTLIRFALLLLALLVMSAGARGERLEKNAVAKAANDVEWKSYVFFSWYDGWGKHTIWGKGDTPITSIARHPMHVRTAWMTE